MDARARLHSAAVGEGTAPLTARDLEMELRDLLDSPDLETVLDERLDRGFEHLEVHAALACRLRVRV